MEEVVTVNDVAQSMPHIYVALDNRQADHQALIIEIKCKITNQPISVLIDLGSNLSYASPKLVKE